MHHHQDIFGKVTKHNKHDSQEVSSLPAGDQKAIVHTILRIGIIRALNESAGKLFRAATQHRQNNSSEKIVPNQKKDAYRSIKEKVKHKGVNTH